MSEQEVLAKIHKFLLIVCKYKNIDRPSWLLLEGLNGLSPKEFLLRSNDFLIENHFLPPTCKYIQDNLPMLFAGCMSLASFLGFENHFLNQCPICLAVMKHKWNQE